MPLIAFAPVNPGVIFFLAAIWAAINAVLIMLWFTVTPILREIRDLLRKIEINGR